MNRKKAFFYSLVGLLIGLLFAFVNRASEVIRLAWERGGDLVDAFDSIGGSIAAKPFYLSRHINDLMASGFVVMALLMFILHHRKVFRPGEEYGSARFGTKQDIKYLVDPTPDHNIILTATESLSMAGRMKITKTEDFNRNKNVLVIGGAGSRKTMGFVKPNLLQMHSSYIVTDPKGTLLTECGHAFEVNHYRIKVLNLFEAEGMRKSLGYNPFAYIRNEADVLKLVDVLMANTNGGEQKQSSDPFWTAAEKLFYCALIGYIWSCGEPEDQNMGTLLDLLNACDAREEDEEYQNPVDLIFQDLKRECPEHFAVRQYVKFRKAAGKTMKSILISCGARLAPFDIQEVRDLMSEDELELDKLGDRKTVLFVITSDTSKTFNFIAAMMYSQMFNLLCDRALQCGGRLKVHVRCLLDEFANIGKIPNFEEIISVIRSREISVCPILQSKAQLESVYDKKTDIIVDNCDTLLFLGSKSVKTLKEVGELLGKQTIDLWNDSKARGSSKTDTTSYQKLGREIMTVRIYQTINLYARLELAQQIQEVIDHANSESTQKEDQASGPLRRFVKGRKKKDHSSD